MNSFISFYIMLTFYINNIFINNQNKSISKNRASGRYPN